MGNSFAEAYHNLLQEDLELLLQRSEEHERQLAEISNERKQLQRQADKITHLTSIADELAKAVKQQDEQIKNLNTAVDKLATAKDKPLSVAARLGNVLYWLCAAVAVISLSVGGIRLHSGIKSHALSRPDDWLFPVVFGILGVSAWLTGRALRYVLRGR